MVFYLPNKYANKNTPTPYIEDIKTERQDERIVVTMRFYGRMSDKKREKYIERLLGILKDNKVQTKGSFFYLNYSDPFVPPPL